MKSAPAAALLAALASGTAWAHAYPQTASPAVGSTVHVAPSQVAIEFNDALEGAFSTIAVQDEQGRRVDDGRPHLAADDPRRLEVGVASLPPGAYRVEWKATDSDTHKTQGHYSFTVAP